MARIMTRQAVLPPAPKVHHHPTHTRLHRLSHLQWLHPCQVDLAILLPHEAMQHRSNQDALAGRVTDMACE